MTIVDFLRESNAIEGIFREPTAEEIRATEGFLTLRHPVIPDLRALVKVYQPDAVLRNRPGLNVRVGRYVAPLGGFEITERLRSILEGLRETDPWTTHCAYQLLHPFTDGNGRSGRTLWLWQMSQRFLGPQRLSFLHAFYYQTLEHQG